RNSHGCANVFLVISRQRVRNHSAEAESGGKDAGGVEAQILLRESQEIVEQGVVLLLPGRAIRTGRDEDGRLSVGLCDRLEAVELVVDHVLVARADPVRDVEQPVRLSWIVVGG